MERILLGMNARHAYWDALDRSVSLAGRMDAKVHVLVVLPHEEDSPQAARDREMEQAVRQRVELLQQDMDPRRMELFIAQGTFEEEVIRFAEQYQITLFIAEQAEQDSPGQHNFGTIETLYRRLRCRVELISHKRHQQQRT